MESYPAVVIGAGQAGLAVSRQLQMREIPHLVLERGRVAETWRSQRWDSFRVNTLNGINGLPGAAIPGDPERFASAEELVRYFEGYAESFGLPIRQGVTVTAVKASGDGFEVLTDHAEVGSLQGRVVVLASGAQNRARIPSLAGQLPSDLIQIHAGQYRNSASLPSGGVLVVGSAQSGCQIAEDLLGAGRRVFLSVSKVARSPRRYRGRDVLRWLEEMGVLGTRLAELPDPQMQFNPQPQISGVGERGHTVSLQDLAAQGTTLVGRLIGVDGRTLAFDDSVAECVRFADTGSAELKMMIDGYIAGAGITADPSEPDPVDLPAVDPDALAGPTRIAVGDIAAVVWTTGFDGDFSWVHLPVIDDRGHLVHNDGITPVPGLYLVGVPWLRTRASGLIAGAGDDAAFIVAAAAEHLKG